VGAHGVVPEDAGVGGVVRVGVYRGMLAPLPVLGFPAPVVR